MIKILKNLATYKWMVASVFGLIFIQSMSDLFLPTLMSDIIDKGVVPGKLSYIWEVGGWMLLVSAVGALASVTASYFSSKAAIGLGRDIRLKVFEHVERFSLHEFDQVGTASLITRTTNDITQVQQVVIMMLRMVISAPIMLVGGIIMAVSKDAKLSLVIVVTLPVLVASILLILYKAVPLFKTVQKRLDRLNLVLRENLTGVRVIRAFNREFEEKKRLQHANKDLRDVSIQVNRIMAFMMPVMMLVMNLTIVGIIWFGGMRIDNGTMQIGDLMAFTQYAMQIMFALVMSSMMFVMVPRAAVSAGRINEVLNIQPAIEDKGAERADAEPGTLEFDRVTFSYPGAEEPALSSISFKAQAGEITAIIGGTGSGKSTLLQLIPRFYECSEGTIRLNGVNIENATQDEIRSKIGFVPQKAVLFTGTIAENICYGKPEASHGEIRHAAEIAQAEDFILKMKDGFESRLEQGGSNLSGGQKQRLSIARAIVRKPDIYLFDDSFSALDFKTDARLRAALKEETRNSTVLLVAQRVNTVMDADQIIVLEKGKIAGMGTHEELLETNEVYREIALSQLTEEEIA
ncbi:MULTISPECIES: ABC transporter ATP-binding protein [Fictibacillus]|uniref:Multidrug ABC transporter ATP-binding protein n=1 Tax=Fictibacillus enclensis TaxID=1017270 RepID=A0A0V8JEV0_9BACL|nr:MULTISPECIES: ABC transporter ATP-binding protein [Fictibacillus]KSU85482.1 multidrug ABC transporter ATP-binding protein [Fictibacillus enclensis]RXY98828.1 ABC transporter ATP-binding protein [Fictibacillus sp. S7]SCB97553.1 ATP-binding cassette, subfamily B [Fictibacillus enclensis]